MLKVLKYIIIFLLGYKILNDLFGRKKQSSISNAPKKQTVETNHQYTTNHAVQDNNQFDDAETIDYEEIK